MRNIIIFCSLFSTLLLAQNTFDKIEFLNIENDQLYLAGFSLEYNRDIYIEVTGSGYDKTDIDSRNIHADPAGLYAYAWIINGDSRKLVWRMTRDNSEKTGNGDLFEFKGKVSLPQGHYEVYYHGQHLKFYSSKSFWNLGKMLKDILVEDEYSKKAKTEWMLSLDGFDNSESEASVVKEINALLDDAVVRIEANRAFMFQKKTIKVSSKVNAEVYAIGEGDKKKNFDYGWIKELDTRRKVWEMKPHKGSHAGGALKNKLYRDNIVLEPGTNPGNFC